MSTQNKNLKILVTGAGGFLGSRLCASLSAAGYDNIYAMVREIPAGDAPAGVKFICADLSHKNFLTSLPEKTDIIVHLANSRAYKKFPEGAKDTFQVNVKATADLLDWAQKSGAEKFILASTGSIYAPHQSPVDENWPCAPEGFYASSKNSAEILARPYAQCMNIDILRIFGLYGPGQKTGMMRDIFEGIREGKDFTLAGGSGPSMTPTYIDDAVCALMLLIADEERGCNIYNLAGDEIVDFSSLLKKAGEICGIVPNVKPSGDEKVRSFMGNGNRLRNKGWKPVTNLIQGMQNMWRSIA